MSEPPNLAFIKAEEQRLYFEPLPNGRASHLSLKESPATLHWSSTPFLPHSGTRSQTPLPRAGSPPRPRKGMAPFSGWEPRDLDDDLEVLIFIPAAYLMATNRSSKSWRSQTDGANRTTSSAKSNPNRTPSTPWLHLDILFIRFITRIGSECSLEGCATMHNKQIIPLTLSIVM